MLTLKGKDGKGRLGGESSPENHLSLGNQSCFVIIRVLYRSFPVSQKGLRFSLDKKGNVTIIGTFFVDCRLRAFVNLRRIYHR